MLISSHGRYVWNEQPFAYRFSDGMLTVTSRRGAIESGRQVRTFREAYSVISRKHFSASGKLPEARIFTPTPGSSSQYFKGPMCRRGDLIVTTGC